MSAIEGRLKIQRKVTKLYRAEREKQNHDKAVTMAVSPLLPEKHGDVRINKHDPAEERESARTARHERRTIKTAAGGSYTTSEWLALCAEYDDRCAKCGIREPLTADHVKPVHLGGDSNIANIQPLCRHCNSSKGAKHIDYRKK